MKIYVVKATFEKPEKTWVDTFSRRKIYEERELFVAYSDGTWEKFLIKGFNRFINAPYYYQTDERLPEWRREVSRFYRLENYIQPGNMVKEKMEKEKVHDYIRTREANWNNY